MAKSMNFEPGQIHVLTVAELADDAFLKTEHLKALSMMQMPANFDERRKAFIEFAEAQAAASRAIRVLNEAVRMGHE